MITLSLHATERSSYFVRVQFKDETGAAVTPTEVNWTLTDGRGSVVNSREGVSETPASTVVIALTDEDLSLANLVGETRYLLIEAVYDSDLGTGLSLRDQAQFTIDDLVKVAG